MREHSVQFDRRLRIPMVVAVVVLVALGERFQARSAGGIQLALTALIIVAWIGNAWRSHPGWVVLLATAALGLDALDPTHSGPAAVVGIVLALVILGRYPTRPGLATAAVIVVAFDVIEALANPNTSPITLVFNVLSLGSAYAISRSFRRVSEEQQRTRAALVELQSARETQLQAAKTEERAHLAREIHDVLAHTLSALAVQVESARAVAEQRPGDPRTLQALERAHGLCREGLEEVRRAVGALRGDNLPGPQLLPELVHTFERDSGVECRLEVEGAPLPLKPDASLAIYRTAQEALTNVRKHAEATAVVLRLRYTENRAELVVEDRGRPKVSVAPGGHGLNGMRERVELLGGTLEAGPTTDGFRVRLLVPT